MMRLQRIRFTIGRMMLGVLVAVLALWGVLSLRPQLIAEQQALASYRHAVRVREVAESAVKEYVDGTYQQEKATYLGQIALAKADLERAMDRLKWSTEMISKGHVSKATNIADKLTKDQADFDLEQAMTQLKVLEGYTKEKRIKSLQSDVAKASAAELSAFATYRIERSKRGWWVLWF